MGGQQMVAEWVQEWSSAAYIIMAVALDGCERKTVTARASPSRRAIPNVEILEPRRTALASILKENTGNRVASNSQACVIYTVHRENTCTFFQPSHWNDSTPMVCRDEEAFGAVGLFVVKTAEPTSLPLYRLM